MRNFGGLPPQYVGMGFTRRILVIEDDPLMASLLASAVRWGIGCSCRYLR
jgi:hypothetical protein